MPTKDCYRCSTQQALDDCQRWKGTSGKVRRMELEIKNCVNCADNSYLHKHNFRQAKLLKRERERLEILKQSQSKGEK